MEEEPNDTTKKDNQPFSPVAVEELCRLCLVEATEDFQRMFDDVDFPHNLFILTQIDIQEGDGLPEQVCQHCLQQMRAALSFVSQCRNSDSILRDFIKKIDKASGRGDHSAADLEEHFERMESVGKCTSPVVGDILRRTLQGATGEAIEAQMEAMRKGKNNSEPDMETILKGATSPSKRSKPANGKWNECDPVAATLCALQNDKPVPNGSLSRTYRGGAEKSSLIRELLSHNFRRQSSEPVTVCVSSTTVDQGKADSEEIEAINNIVEVQEGSAANEIVTCDYEQGSPRIAGDIVEEDSHVMSIKLEEGAEFIEAQATDTKVFSSGELFFFDVQEEVIVTEDVDAEEEHTPPLEVPGVANEGTDYTFACEMCDKMFRRKNALLSHMKLHTFIDSYSADGSRSAGTSKCDTCGKCYISKAGLRAHRAKAHPEAIGGCPECGVAVESREELATHLKAVHGKARGYECNRCFKTFVKRKTFVAHTQIHPQNVYKCTVCMRTYSDEAEFKQHVLAHKAHDSATGADRAQGGPVPPGGEAQFQRMKFEYCISYVGLVKSMFADQPDMYAAFLESIKDFKYQRINVQGLLVRISQLFKDHRELIAGFNTFMPHGFKIDLPVDSLGSASPEVATGSDDQSQGPDMDLDYSLSYLSQIKSMFANQPKIYNDFTFIIKEYKLQTMEIPEVIRRVSHLFRDYPELIAGFNSFLPPWCKIKVPVSQKKEKEDIDPLEPGSSANNRPAEPAGKARPMAVDAGKRLKRKSSVTAADASKKVKTELVANDARSAAESVQIITEAVVVEAAPSVVETEEVLEDDVGGATPFGAFVCHACLKSFPRKNLLQAHVQENHAKR